MLESFFILQLLVMCSYFAIKVTSEDIHLEQNRPIRIGGRGVLNIKDAQLMPEADDWGNETTVEIQDNETLQSWKKSRSKLQL